MKYRLIFKTLIFISGLALIGASLTGTITETRAGLLLGGLTALIGLWLIIRKREPTGREGFWTKQRQLPKTQIAEKSKRFLKKDWEKTKS